MPARDRTNSLTSLQGLFDQTNLLVVTPAPSTLDAQHLYLHSLYDLKARLEVTSSESRPNYTRRPSPERYAGCAGVERARRIDNQSYRRNAADRFGQDLSRPWSNRRQGRVSATRRQREGPGREGYPALRSPRRPAAAGHAGRRNDQRQHGSRLGRSL